MMSFLIYEGKVAAALLVFYLFYRFLLRKETFHRFNRIVLVATALLSFILPLCIITIHKQIVVDAEGVLVANGVAVPTVAQPWWHIALFALFWAGVAFVLCRVAVSVISILRIVRGGEQVATEDGCRLISATAIRQSYCWWMSSLLCNGSIRPSGCSAATCRNSTNMKRTTQCSAANSFNHSTLKNRITMMSKSKSPLARGLRVLYLLPLICLALSLQARTVYEPVVKANDNNSNAVQDTTKITKIKVVGYTVAADGTAYSKEDSVKIRVVNPNAGDPKKTKKSLSGK